MELSRAPNDPKTTAVPSGYIADVITHLEMLERPAVEIPESSLTIEIWSKPAADDYLKIFRSVGEPWLWLSRLLLSDSELNTILRDDENIIFRVQDGNQTVGIVELDYRQAGECEISFFGLIPVYSGQGHGKWLMAETLKRAWRSNISRVWLHTCTLDSPYALGFYQRAGFTAFKREMSMGPDPRLIDLLPETAGPNIPIIR